VTSNAEITHEFTAAQNARDADDIAALLAEYAHFESARLPIAADARANVTQSLTDRLDAHTEYELKTIREFYAGDEGYNESRFTAKKGGEPIETHGVDYYRFKDGLIVEKNSFRKFLFYAQPSRTHHPAASLPPRMVRMTQRAAHDGNSVCRACSGFDARAHWSGVGE